MDTLEFIKENAVCCISGRSLKDCKRLNWVPLNMKASWMYPVWSDSPGVDANKAVAFVHDDCIKNNKVTGVVVNAIEVTGRKITYHPVTPPIVKRPGWDVKKQGLDTTAFCPLSLKRTLESRLKSLSLFSESIGWKFCVTGLSIVDFIKSVNHETQMVKGINYGEFHIDACEMVPSAVKRAKEENYQLWK